MWNRAVKLKQSKSIIFLPFYTSEGKFLVRPQSPSKLPPYLYHSNFAVNLKQILNLTTSLIKILRLNFDPLMLFMLLKFLASVFLLNCNAQI